MSYIISDELRAKKAEAGRKGAQARQETLARRKQDEQRRLELTQEFDKTLAIEIDQLRQHTNTLEQVVPGTDVVIDWTQWLDYAEAVLRGCEWDKKYPPLPGEWLGEHDIPHEDQVYFEIYPDEACGEQLCWTFTKFTPELNSMLVRVLEAFLAWHARHPEQKVEHVPKITRALQTLKNGGTLYRESVVQSLQEEYQLKQQRLQQEREEAERIRNVPAPVFVSTPPPPIMDPLLVAAEQAKAQAWERAKQEEDNRLRQLSPEAWAALHQR